MSPDPNRWDNPLDPVAVTTDAVADGRLPVLRVVHELGHGGWQLYDDVEELTAPVILPKELLIASDSTIRDVTDLPVGWEAAREDASSPWIRRAAK